MDGFKNDSLEHRTHVHIGRKFGKNDYMHAEESKHLDKKSRKESHPKHDELLGDRKDCYAD
jgi:hypothetical protein